MCRSAMTETKKTSSSSSSEVAPIYERPPLRERYGFWKELFLTLNVLVYMPMYTMLLCLILYSTMVYFAPNMWIRTLLLLYIPFILLDPTPSKGYRKNAWRSWYRSLVAYKWFAQYFDMKLVKTADLDPSHHYIMLYHPHGIIAVGANPALNTNGCDFEQVFPGLQRAPVTLTETFYAPLLREWILHGLGFISANKHTLVEALEHQSIVLVPGGAAEALHARPGVMKLYLKNRKGFVRLALETNSPLVPCIGFGENEVFDSSEPTSMQHYWMKLLRFSVPFLKHFVPRPAKIAVVVGEPLKFTSKDVDRCHAEYLEHLRKLYDAHKHEHGYQDIPLEII